MRTIPLLYGLSLLGLPGKVQGNTQVVVPECTIKGWVRAPDLAPSTVVQGDARIKINPECPTIETVTLGLRLKERSFVKALRESEERKRRAGMHTSWSPAPDPRASSPWDWPPSVRRHANDSDETALREALTDRDLWIVREEERIVFETTQHLPLSLADGVTQGYDVVQDFAILVPSTNFPPALDFSSGGPVVGQLEIADVESIYEYFFRVPLENGTTAEIAAGITSFQPLYNPANPHAMPVSEDIEANLKRVRFPEEDFLTTNYTVQITGVSESTFTLGSDLQVTTIITRTGPARTFTLPLTIHGCVEPKISSKWAVEHDPEGSNDWLFRRPQRILRFTSQDIGEGHSKFRHVHPCCFNHENRVSVMMPNSTEDEVRSQDIVITRSEPITIPITVDRHHIPDFEMYYQVLASVLEIVIETPRTEDENIDPDDPSMQPCKNTNRLAFEDDEEEWVPWEEDEKPSFLTGPLVSTVWHTYSRSIPVPVRPIEEVASSQGCLHSNAVSSTKDQVVISGETGCVQPRLTHYLEEDARGPIFVDPGALSEVLAENPAERERPAPILQPMISSPPKGEELVYRYYTPLRSFRPVYVGETWVRKVTHKKHL